VQVDGRRGRLRELARDGLLLITTEGVDEAAVRAAAAGETGPVRVLSLPEVDVSGEVAAALSARPAEVWVVRPDAHIAAVLMTPSGAQLRAVLDRVMARRTREEQRPDGVLQAVR
jgi:3-(3-hydroxy-phenyl)propionate hydroxylase